MSISESFRKRSKAVLLAATVGLAGAGGYTGMQIAEQQVPDPVTSALTLAQHNQDSLEGETSEALRLKEAGEDPHRVPTLNQFRNLIERMEQDRREADKMDAFIAYTKARADKIVIDTNLAEALKEKETQGAVLHAALQAQADRFVNQLRLSEHITEMDYGNLMREFDARAGVTPSDKTGNYRAGVMYHQECKLVSSFADFFSFGDEDLTEGEEALKIGTCMQEARRHYENKKTDSYKIAGAAGGALAGGLLSLPLWRRRKSSGPRV